MNVNLKKDADGYQLAPVLANLTYALSDVYGVTDRANNDIFLNVYDTSKNLIINAKFSADKNAFEYFNVAESSRQAQPAEGGQQQPAYGQQQQPRIRRTTTACIWRTTRIYVKAIGDRTG